MTAAVSAPKAALNAAHAAMIFGRRVQVLSRELGRMLEPGAHVLDVGCGDGSIDLALMAETPSLKIEGVDVLVRQNAKLPTTLYDGHTLPFADKSFDFVSFVDVLHHTDHPAALLAEARRVARRGVVLKDHLREGWLAGPVLRAMDWVGNYGHGVVLPYNYLNRAEWDAAFASAGLKVERWTERLGIYTAPVSWICDRRLHFVARLAEA